MPKTKEADEADLALATEGVGPAKPSVGRSLLSSMVYAFGFGVQGVIGALMLPVYTRVISPSEFGTLGILLSAYFAVGILFAVGLEPSIVRNYFQLASEPDRRQEFLDSLWRFLVVYPLVASLVLAAAAWPFGRSAQYAGHLEVTLMLLAAALNAMATVLPLSVLRARQHLRGYLSMTLVPATLTPALTVFFVAFAGQGIRGWFLAALISSLATFAIAVKVVPWHPRARINWRMVRAALLFSLPLVPHFLSHWALQLADRWVIAGMVSASDLGTYTIAGVLATPVMMLVIALNQGLTPTYARAGARGHGDEELYNVVTLQLTVVVGLTLAGAVVGPSLVQVLTAPDYHGAAPLLPWIVLGYGFLGMYFVPMNGATLGAGRTTFAWIGTALSAAANIALLFILVPRYGLYSAAVASAIGYLLLLSITGVWAHARPNPVRYDWLRLGQALAAGSLAYLGALLTSPDSLVAAVAVQTGWLLAFCGAVAATGFRSQVMARLRSPARP